jgi:phosphoribosylamine--glycine ligase
VKLLVVGSGGREHAIVHALAASPKVDKVYAAPGNGGISEEAEVLDVPSDSVDELVRLAVARSIDLTFIGPEVPLSKGVVDRFNERGLPVIGPTADQARLESSKTFTKHLCTERSIPTAAYTQCATVDEANRALEMATYPTVIKADGLAAGKGVVIAESPDEARRTVKDFMVAGRMGNAGSRLVIEDFLEGEEASFHVFADGLAFRPMVASQDHKRRFKGDSGPNTGGMGAYSVDAILSEALQLEVIDRLIRPTLEAMGDYFGILYAGLMMTAEGPKLVEYNVRFGDPEAQVILPRLETDLADVFIAMRDHRLSELEIRWSPLASATVVLVSQAYPGKIEAGKEIFGLNEAQAVQDVFVYHAGTRRKDGRVYTAGGRVLNVTAVGQTLTEALDKAYFVAEMIDFEGKDYRSDVGHKMLKRNE